MSFKLSSYLLNSMLLCATISLPTYASDIQSNEKLANQRDTKAQYEWEMLLVDGNKVKQDTITDRKWLEKAATQGNMTAQNYLAGIHRFGQGVPVDTNRAKSIYKKLCDEGQETACNTYKDIEQKGK